MNDATIEMQIRGSDTLKRAYAEQYIEAINSLQTNPRFPKTICAIIDEMGNVTGFDLIAAVHESDAQHPIETVTEWLIGDGWETDPSTGELLEGQVDLMISCLSAWDVFK